MMLLKNRKLFNISAESEKRIKREIEQFAQLPKGIFAKMKYYSVEQVYHIKIIVDKEYLKIDSSNKNYSLIPDTINFLVILDYSYPKEPPKILCQTNVSL